MPCRLFRCAGDGNDRGSRLVGWVSRLPSNCGIFATNDQVAQEVLSACVTAGRSVPGDLKVLGVDNVLSRCETCSPTLSSIQIDFEMAGYRAADLLMRRMYGEGRRPQRAAFGPDIDRRLAARGPQCPEGHRDHPQRGMSRRTRRRFGAADRMFAPLDRTSLSRERRSFHSGRNTVRAPGARHRSAAQSVRAPRVDSGPDGIPDGSSPSKGLPTALGLFPA